jgi:hypothetical protein
MTLEIRWNRNPRHQSSVATTSILQEAVTPLGAEESAVTPGDDSPAVWHEVAGSVVSLMTGALSLLFLLAYGVLRQADVELYAHFGISPSDIGIDQISTVARAATFVGVNMAVLAGAVITGALSFRGVRSVIRQIISLDSKHELSTRLIGWFGGLGFRVRAVALVALTILVILVVIFEIRQVFLIGRVDTNHLKHGQGGIALYIVIVSAFMGLALGAAIPVDLGSTVSVALLRFLRKWLLPSAIAVILVVGAVGALDFWGRVDSLGVQLMAGSDTQPAAMATVQWLQVDPRPIRIISTEDPLGLAASQRMPYLLGQNGDQYFVLMYGQPSYVVVLSNDYSVVTGVSDPSVCVGSRSGLTATPKDCASLQPPAS